MQAYEFFAKPEDGMIKIPEQYRNRVVSEVKVILLDQKERRFDGEAVNTLCKSDLLLPPTADTTGWKFSREEANER